MSAAVWKEGFLLKRSDVIKSWNTRLVMLSPTRLEWVKPPQDAASGKSPKVGDAPPPRPRAGVRGMRGILLSDITSVSRGNALRQDFMLEIRTADPAADEILLAGGSEDEVLAWETAIRSNWRECAHAKRRADLAGMPSDTFQGRSRDRTAAFMAARTAAAAPRLDRAQACVNVLLSMAQVGTDKLPTVVWQEDSEATVCPLCDTAFVPAGGGVLRLLGSKAGGQRRHHCRVCGRVVCATCSSLSLPLSYDRISSFAAETGIDMDIERYQTGISAKSAKISARVCTDCVGSVSLHSSSRRRAGTVRRETSCHPIAILVMTIQAAKARIEEVLEAETGSDEPTSTPAVSATDSLAATVESVFEALRVLRVDAPKTLKALEESSDDPLLKNVRKYLNSAHLRLTPRVKAVMPVLNAKLVKAAQRQAEEARASLVGDPDMTAVIIPPNAVAFQNVTYLSSTLVSLRRIALEVLMLEQEAKLPTDAVMMITSCFHIALDTVTTELEMTLVAAPEFAELDDEPGADRGSNPIEVHMRLVTSMAKEAVSYGTRLLAPGPILQGCGSVGELCGRVIHCVCTLLHGYVYLPLMRSTPEGQVQPSKRAVKTLIQTLAGGGAN